MNQAVTQANIGSTTWISGYTSTIRPASSCIAHLKEKQLSDLYSFCHDSFASDFEGNHLISLEIGRNPSSPLNLWPQPYAGPTGARAKDTTENNLYSLVCLGQLPLKVAQRAIAINWYMAYLEYFDC